MSIKQFTFDTPTKYQDGTPISATDLASISYRVLIDTVNPPVKGFPVPASNLAGARVNADGSKTVTVLFTDLGFAPTANTQYYYAAQDSLGTMPAAISTVVPFANAVAPNAPSNPTAA